MSELRISKVENESELPVSVLSDEQMNAAQLLGAVKGSILVSRAVSAEAIKTLGAIRDEKLYVHFGSRTFEAFLDEHPESPMTYSQFNQRESLLEREGALTFQLLNTLRIPAAKRRLLTAGEINVNGREVEINGEKFSVASDLELRKLIVAIIDEKTAAERAVQEKDKTIERGRKEVEKQKRLVADLRDRALSGGVISADATPHFRALVSLLGDYQLLAQEVSGIDDATEKQRFGALALDRLAEAKLQFENVLGFQAPENKLRLSPEDEEELLASAD